MKPSEDGAGARRLKCVDCLTLCGERNRQRAMSEVDQRANEVRFWKRSRSTTVQMRRLLGSKHDTIMSVIGLVTAGNHPKSERELTDSNALTA